MLVPGEATQKVYQEQKKIVNDHVKKINNVFRFNLLRSPVSFLSISFFYCCKGPLSHMGEIFTCMCKRILVTIAKRKFTILSYLDGCTTYKQYQIILQSDISIQYTYEDVSEVM